MNETELGYMWDIGFNSEAKGDVVIIDAGDEVITLSKSDLLDMLRELEDEET